MPYCSECGAETSVGDYYCSECGAEVNQTDGSPPVQTTATGATNQSHSEEVQTQPTGGGSPRQTQFYIGAVLGVLAVVFVPFVFVFVAIPESIHRLRGGSIQNYLPKDARDNAYVSGSMLILGWFGNFLLLVIFLLLIIVIGAFTLSAAGL